MSIDVEWFSELCRRLHQGVSGQDTWTDFVTQLGEYLPADFVALSVRMNAQPATQRTGVFHAPHCDQASHQPLLAVLESDRPFECSHRTFALRGQFVLGFDLADSGYRSASLLVARAVARGAFLRPHYQLIQLLKSHVRAAVGKRVALEKIRSECAHYADAMDRLAIATIILDEVGHVVYVSALAESMIDDELEEVSIENGLIRFIGPENARKLGRIIERAASARANQTATECEIFRVRTKDRSEVQLIARLLPKSPGPRENSLAVCIAIFLNVGSHASVATREATMSKVQELFRLTLRETVLALELTGGASLREAARNLGISESTARSHMRAIFSKTGFERQATLIRALLRSVAMLS